ncbi:MAG: DUF4286 family protein [Streptosporangiales bacterium]|nr:DUF4286 family protein [Streptosporangiales bacterium]
MAERKLYLVFGNPNPGQEEEFDEWYDTVHIPDVMSVGNIVSAQRFRYRQLDRDAGQPVAHVHLTVYELEGDPDEFMTKMIAAVSSGKVRMQEAPFNSGTVSMSFWEPVTEKAETPG